MITEPGKNIYSTTQKYDVVSFDLFDTLIFRTVSKPAGIFDLVSLIYEKQTGQKCKGFKDARIRAENAARRKHHREINIDEIYDELSSTGWNRELLKLTEEQCEIDNCIPNRCMIDFANTMFASGKTIIVVTDMYLKRHTIEAILKKIGLNYSLLFISGEEKATKLSGELYGIVLEKMNCKSEAIIHFGDNPITDIQQAERNGIHAELRIADDFFLKYQNSDKRQKRHRSILDEHYDVMYRHYDGTDDHTVSNIGYSRLGPFLYDFCIWLKNKQQETAADEIVFVSREGYLLHKAYISVFPEDSEHAHYMGLNKNILRKPLMQDAASMPLFDCALPSRTMFSVDEILKLLLINDIETKKASISKKVGISGDWQYRRNDTSEEKKRFFSALCECCKSSIADQSDFLSEYLKQNRLTNKKVLLVNNSINGNGQFLLQSFSEKHNCGIQFIGIQFSKSVEAAKKELPIHSYLRECGERGDSMALARCSIFFEHLLFENVGTAMSLMKNGGKIEVITETRRKEMLNDQIINGIQKSALDFIFDNLTNIQADSYRVSIKRFLLLFKRPSLAEVDVIGNLFDDDSNADAKLLSVKNRNEMDCKSLMKEFRRTGWKQGFLKKLGYSDLIIRIYDFFEDMKNIYSSRNLK